MSSEKLYTAAEAERFFAARFHGKTWDLLDKKERTADENECMLDFAHASLAHWRTAGTATHHQRGEWMLARVYAVLGNGILALKHASRCHELLDAHPAEMEDFDFAFAYEALARANAAAGNLLEAQEFIKRAQEAGSQIHEAEERDIFFAEFNGGNWFGAKQSQ